MTNSFANILVPVGFSASSKIAIEKAIELSGPDTVIHLFHVHENYPFRVHAGSYKNLLGTDFNIEHQTSEDKLNRLRGMIEQKNKNLKITATVSFGDAIEPEIIRASKMMNADLIIIGKTSHHTWFPFLNKVHPVKISEQTYVPVLTAKPGSLNQKIKKIVVPITGHSTEKKLDVLTVLSKKFRVSVFLVTFMHDGRPDDFQGSALMHAYHETMEKLHLNVHYSVLHGHNKAKELLKHAETISADILLVYAGKETTIGWPNKQISDVLQPESRIQVLAVHPNH